MAIAITASFLLHLVTIFVIILLSMKVSSMKELSVKQEELQKEIEDVFSSYILEMKEENEKLLHAIQQKKAHPAPPSAEPAKPAIKQAAQPKPSSKAVSRVYQINQKASEQPRSTSSSPSTDDFTAPLSKGNEQFVQSLASKALEYEKEGYTIEQIAQKLNKGKTEIELLLKFRREK